MRYLRVTAEPDAAMSPEAFRILADSDHVEEARLEEWNLGGEGVTGLYTVDGDCEGARDALAAAPAVRSVSLCVLHDRRGYLLVRLDLSVTRLGQHIFELLATHGLVVLKPIVYRDGTVRARIVGENPDIQAVLDHIPPDVDVEVHEISGTIPRPDTVTATLSDRQREALRAALDLGYYDQPRQATHEDVADRLGCAPSTATEHLQKAEAKLARTAFVGRE